MIRKKETRSQIQHSHSLNAIQERVEEAPRHEYLGDFLLGAIDGLVTTFAVVAGVAGAGMSTSVALILGVANLLADGFSMAAGNYQNVKSEHELLERARRMEERHIAEIPEGEVEEVRQIYAAKGFEGDLLEQIVKVIISDKELWINTMLTEELGLKIHIPSSFKSALTTFWAFVLVGLIPLFPYILPISLSEEQTFWTSSMATATAFFVVGAFKGKTIEKSVLKSGLETFFLGGTAAILAYVVGLGLKSLM